MDDASYAAQRAATTFAVASEASLAGLPDMYILNHNTSHRVMFYSKSKDTRIYAKARSIREFANQIL
jgi:hypothetical protein